MSASTEAINNFLLSLGFDIAQIDTDALAALFERIVAILPAVSSQAESHPFSKPQMAEVLKKACSAAQLACGAIAPSFLVIERVYQAYQAAGVSGISANIDPTSDRRQSTIAGTLRERALETRSESDIYSVKRETAAQPESKKQKAVSQSQAAPLAPYEARCSRKSPDWIVRIYRSLAFLYQPLPWLLQSQIAAAPESYGFVSHHASTQNLSRLIHAAVQHIVLREGTLSVLNTSLRSAASYVIFNPQPCRNVSSTTSVQQQNTYNIYGSNALEIASDVELRQHSANARIIRTNQHGVG